jgi:malonyl CoA-acyl carrier protein transacylase
VVVHGTPDATKHLAEYCRKNSDMEVKTVFTPATGETVDATRESHIYQVENETQFIRNGDSSF